MLSLQDIVLVMCGHASDLKVHISVVNDFVVSSKSRYTDDASHYIT